MASVGSYVLSLQERQQDNDTDLQSASTRVLKVIGVDKPQSLVRLMSETGLPEGQLQSAVTKLTREGLLVGNNNDGFSLTKLGYQARLIVSG